MTRYVKELKPQTVRHLAAMVALYRPGPMAHIPNYIARKEGRQDGRVPGPLAGRPAGRDVRDHRLPGPGAPDRAAGGRLLAGPGRHPAPSDGEERPQVRCGTSARASWTAPRSAATPPRRPRSSGSTSSRSPATPSTRPTPSATRSSPTRRRTSRRTTRSSGWRPSSRLTWRSPRRSSRRSASAGGSGIPILVPNINYSQVRFTVERVEHRAKAEFDRGIRFGLAAIKNVGEGAVESVVAEREKNGPFKSLDDFCGRVDLRTVNKRVMEALVKCGAMDDFGPRERVLAGIDGCMGNGQKRAEGRQRRPGRHVQHVRRWRRRGRWPQR